VEVIGISPSHEILKDRFWFNTPGDFSAVHFIIILAYD